MTILKSIFVTALALYFPTATESNPYVISDDRVRNLDVTPVLGRGYSVMTNSFQSTCLDVKETTVPSFNYEYEFYEFSSSSNMESGTTAALSVSYAWSWLRAEVNADYSSNSKVEKQKQFIVASMRIERYYASVKEDNTKISQPAVSLLDRQDYVSFFKACGPTYVRGIRRAQEVTAILKYETTSTEQARDYSRSVQTNYGYSSNYSNNSKNSSVEKSMNIVIKAYGLGLTETGSESFLATTIEEFNKIMIFAYNQMTKSPYANHVGMVYGIEVAPWVENIEFQIVSKVQDEAIEIPQAKSLIPLAYKRTNVSDTNFDNSDQNARDEYRCKDLSYAIDKYGYCCEYESLYDFSEEEYNMEDPSTKICRPIRTLDKSMVTENMAANGEFVARLDRALRYKMNAMSTLEKCISAVQGIPARFNHHFLKAQDSVNYDKQVDGIFTVFDMRNSVDPFGDYGVVKHMAKELDEYIEMFYSPCLEALFGSKIGKTSSTSPSYFMAYAWHTHDECSKLSCLANNMRWDRDNGGCVPSLLSGGSSPAAGYNGTSAFCAKDVNADGEQVCKHSSTDLAEFHTKISNCWGKTLPSGSASYFMEHFCMPVVTANALEGDAKEALENDVSEACSG